MLFSAVRKNYDNTDGVRQSRVGTKGGNTYDIGDFNIKLLHTICDEEHSHTDTDTVLSDRSYRKPNINRNKRDLPDDVGYRQPKQTKESNIPDDHGNQNEYWDQKREKELDKKEHMENEHKKKRQFLQKKRIPKLAHEKRILLHARQRSFTLTLVCLCC